MWKRNVEPLSQQPIYAQLDLVYEFCQWALAHLVLAQRTHVTLYRGVNSFDEHQIQERCEQANICDAGS